MRLARGLRAVLSRLYVSTLRASLYDNSGRGSRRCWAGLTFKGSEQLREKVLLNLRRRRKFAASPEAQEWIALVLQVTIKVGQKEVATVRRLAATGPSERKRDGAIAVSAILLLTCT
jgi:hypothetical protein